MNETPEQISIASKCYSFIENKWAAIIAVANSIVVPPVGNGLLNGIAAYWKMDEAGLGDTRVDATGNGLDLDPGAGVPAAAGIINNGAAVYLSASGLIDSGSGTAHGGDFSVSIWLFSLGNTGTDIAYQSFDFTIYIQYGGAGIQAGFNTTDGSVNPMSNVNPTVLQWTNIVATRNASTNTCNLYINSVLKATATNTGTIIGSWPDEIDVGNGSGENVTQGVVDETGIWNAELTQAQVTALYNGGAALPFSSFTT